MAANKKTQRKTAKAKAPAVDLIAAINKINNMEDGQPGLDIVNNAIKSLQAHIAKKPADATATRKAVRALKGTIREFTTDANKNYRTPEAKKLARLVSDFIRVKAGTSKLKRGAKTMAEMDAALAFKDRVNKANATPKSPRWSAEVILEAVENIPELVKGVDAKAEVQKMYDNAKRKGKKFTKAASAYINGLWAAGNDRNCDIVHKKGRKYIPRPKTEIKSAIQRSGSAR